MAIKPASLNEIKNTLKTLREDQLQEYFLRVIKFKKENKELVSYFLFLEEDIPQFIADVKLEMVESFSGLKLGTTYTRTKALRKILKGMNKYIKFSADKVVEAELTIFFCKKMKVSSVKPGTSQALTNLYSRQVDRAEKAILQMHEEQRSDYKKDMEELKDIM